MDLLEDVEKFILSILYAYQAYGVTSLKFGKFIARKYQEVRVMLQGNRGLMHFLNALCAVGLTALVHPIIPII